MSIKNKFSLKMCIFICVILGLMFFLLWPMAFRHVRRTVYLNHRYQNTIIKIYYVLSEYVHATGMFPDSEQSLIEQGLIRKKMYNGIEAYEYRTKHTQSEWSELDWFADFTIAYGANLQNLELKHNRIIDKVTGESILLISGPSEYIMRSFCNRFSVKILKQFIDTKNKKEKGGIIKTVPNNVNTII